MPHDLNSLSQQVQLLCKNAGAFIRQESKSFGLDKAEYKGLNDLFSYVDLGSEKILAEGLKALLPESQILAEETHKDSGDRELIWIIDPLDGTTNFTHGVPHYCVSVALMLKNEIVLGVVYEVYNDQCFHSIAGGKSYLNGVEISCTSTGKLNEALLATGFSVSNFSQLEINMKRLAYFIQHSHGVRRLGTAALDLCYVACGIFDAYYESDLAPWDVAAGALIAENAGCRVADYQGSSDYIFGRQIAVANQQLFPAFIQAINSPTPT